MPWARAQRRLPSMMIARCRSPAASERACGTASCSAAGSVEVRETMGASDGHDLGFLRREHLVDLLDLGIGQLLHLLGRLVVRVLGQLAVLLQLLQLLHAVARSEEHTSELQSRPHLVCRLLLEKKKLTYGYEIRPSC